MIYLIEKNWKPPAAPPAAAAAAAATARGVGETHLEALVHHWRRAGPSPHAQEKAVHYLTLLGDRALDNFSLVESEELHTAALNIVDAEAAAAQGGGGAVRAQRGPLLRRIARRHFLQGQHKAAEARLPPDATRADAEHFTHATSGTDGASASDGMRESSKAQRIRARSMRGEL